MTQKDLVVSADGHIRAHGPLLDPTPQAPPAPGGVGGGLRDRAAGGGRGPRLPAPPHPGFRGLHVSRFRHYDGSPNTGDPDRIVEDLDLDGIDAQLMHPNLSLFGLYSDDHELSMAHARVYNDYIVERFTPYFTRLAPTAPVPLSDIGDAVAEIERVAAAGFRAILLPAIPPSSYSRGTWTRCGRRHRPTDCTSSSTPRPAA